MEKVCAHYSRLGRAINRESFGPLSATLQPPAIVIAIQLIEMLLSLEEGVKSFSVSFSQSGSMTQDVVTANVLKKLAREYADRFGHEDAAIHLVYHQWMGAFPRNKEYADALITSATVIAAMVRADKIIVKTRDEAFGIPTKEANARAVASVQYTLGMLQGLPAVRDEEEEAHQEAMVRSILESILEDDADSLWRKVFNAIKEGRLEIPFSPHVINANEVITVRDPQGDIRFYDKGRLPISDKAYAYEKAKIRLRDGQSVVEKIIEDIGIMQ